MPETKKTCHCTAACGHRRTERTRRRHYKRAEQDGIMAASPESSSSEFDDDSDGGQTSQHPLLRAESPIPMSIDPPSPHDDDADTHSETSSEPADDIEMDIDNLSDASGDYDDGYFNLLDLEGGEAVEIEAWSGFDEVQDRDEPISREEMISRLEEMIGPEDDIELWGTRKSGPPNLALVDTYSNPGNDVLTENDRDNIRAFKLKMMSNMSRDVFEQLRYAFDHKLDLSSEWAMIHRMAILSAVEPVWYHCCVNSCLAYTGDDSEEESCRFCHEPRYTPNARKPRRLFPYLPIIPRLQGYFQNPKMVEKLLYRHRYVHEPNTIADVFDGIHYRTLRQQNVVVDGQELPHKYFSGQYDIALGVALDGFLLFKRNRGGPSATPILVQNFCISPEIRTHLGYEMCAGVIGGPRAPKDTRSYLIPYDDELAQLAFGVQTFDALTRTEFMLRAYNIFEMGDIIAMEKVINITGHNGFSPCRSCEIKGVRNVAGGDTIYYVPLTAPIVDGKQRAWNPRKLPLRSHDSFAAAVAKVEKAGTVTKKKKIIQFHGIKGLPALRRVRSLSYGKSAPWELMHLAFENNVPNLVKHWTGQYKGLDSGVEDYEIPAETWDLIWQETADAIRHIPAAFVRVLGSNPSYFTAEAWCFWMVYLAPALLKGRFRHEKYYTHACQFSSIIKRCIDFQITYTQIDELEDDIIDWVQKYEKYVSPMFS